MRFMPLCLIAVLALAATVVLPLTSSEAARAPAKTPPRPAAPIAPTPVPATPAAPVDPAAEAAKANEVFQSLFGDEMKRAAASTATADDAAMAAKLLDAARTPAAPLALVVLLCEKACELGSKDPRGYDTALAAADLLAAKAPDRAGTCQETVLVVRQRQYESARADERTRLGDAFIERLLDIAAAKAQAGDFEEAVRRARQATTVAHAIRSASTEEIDAILKHYVDLQRVLGQIPRLKAALVADPANQAAREQIIRLFLVELDNPREAAQYLNDSCDATLRKYVPAAAKDVESAPELAAMELADWYRDLAPGAITASGKLAMFQRSAAYYRRFMEVHQAADLDRTKAEISLRKAEADIEKLGPAVPTFKRIIDLVRIVNLPRDAPGGHVTQTDEGLVLDANRRYTPKVNLPMIPVGNYELEVRFTRTAGADAVILVLPVGNTAVALFVGGNSNRASGLGDINGDGYNQNETTVRAGIDNGRACTVVARVATAADRANIVVTLDGRSFIHWTGPQSALTLARSWAPPDDRCPAFESYRTNATLHGARLRMLTGKAVSPTKGAPAATAAPPTRAPAKGRGG